MDNKITYETANDRPLKLSDLMWEIVLRWRLWVISAIAFAVLLGGMKYVQDMRAAKQAESGDVDIEDIRVQLTDEENTQLLIAFDLRTQLENLECYQRESIRFHLNPYAENIVSLVYYVEIDHSEGTEEEAVSDSRSEITGAYVSYVANNDINRELCAQLDWDIQESYIGELVSAWVSAYSTSNNRYIADADVFRVRIAGASEEDAAKVADVVSELLAQYQLELNEKIGPHELVLINRSSSVEIDGSLAAEQRDLSVILRTLRVNLSDLVAQFSEKQLLVWDEFEAENSSVKDAAQVETDLPGISIKYVLLGAFGGAFLACLWIVICGLWNSRIKNVDELQQMYGIRGFGNLPESEKEKRILAFVDRWLLSLRYKEQWTENERRDLILTNIKVTCKKEAIDHIFITSSVHFPEESRTKVEQLIEGLRKFDITAEYGDCITSNAASFERMAQIGQTILVEKAEVSKYVSVGKEIGVCREQNVNILGVIVI